MPAIKSYALAIRSLIMDFVWLTFYSQVNAVKVMSNTVNLDTYTMLRPPKQITSTKSTPCE